MKFLMENSAIYCESLRLSFERIVIDSLNLSVPFSSIYGLVGASGCGKTTLIRCIWGYLKPSHGIIRTLGCQLDTGNANSLVPSSRIGYMPQDVCLDLCLTAHETLIYFGKCYNISDGELERKMNGFREVLKISDINQKVDNLSSGQRRRLSFVCSIIHEPSLLLLDEPTVGLDPVARDLIWKYIFEQRNKNGVTVLVTTHYIDELINSDSIGIMQNGKIRIEVNPTVIRSRFPGRSLSSVVSELMIRDHVTYISDESSRKSIIDQHPSSTMFSGPIENISNSIEKNIQPKSHYFSPFIYRELRLAQRMILIPSILVIACNFISVLTFAIIYGNFESDLISLAIIDPHNQSKFLLDAYPLNGIRTLPLSNELEALASVESKMFTGYILFTENFQINMEEWVNCLYKNHPSCTGKYVGIIQYRGDYSNQVISDYIRWALDESVRNIAANLSKISHNDSSPLDFIKSKALVEIPGNDKFYRKAYHEIVWRVIVPITFTGSLLLLGEVLVSNKNSSIIERKLAIGFRRHHIVLYNLIWNILISLIISYLSYFITIPLADLVNKRNDNIFPLIIVSIMTINSVLITHILVELVPNITAVLLANFGLVISGFSIGHILWPQESLPYYGLFLPHIIPSPAGGDAVVDIVIRGMDFSSEKVIWSLIELLIHSVIYILIFIRINILH